MTMTKERKTLNLTLDPILTRRLGLAGTLIFFYENYNSLDQIHHFFSLSLCFF